MRRGSAETIVIRRGDTPNSDPIRDWTSAGRWPTSGARRVRISPLAADVRCSLSPAMRAFSFGSSTWRRRCGWRDEDPKARAGIERRRQEWARRRRLRKSPRAISRRCPDARPTSAWRAFARAILSLRNRTESASPRGPAPRDLGRRGRSCHYQLPGRGGALRWGKRHGGSRQCLTKPAFCAAVMARFLLSSDA